jgi:hypothetical protein
VLLIPRKNEEFRIKSVMDKAPRRRTITIKATTVHSSKECYLFTTAIYKRHKCNSLQEGNWSKR